MYFPVVGYCGEILNNPTVNWLQKVVIFNLLSTTFQNKHIWLLSAADGSHTAMIQFVPGLFSFAVMSTWEDVSQNKKILRHTASGVFYSFSWSPSGLFGTAVNKT